MAIAIANQSINQHSQKTKIKLWFRSDWIDSHQQQQQSDQ